VKSDDHPSAAGYERLAARDAAFLDMEDGHATMLLGAVLLVERASLVRPDGSFAAAWVRALVASRLHRVPRFRRRLVGLPGGARAWVDDPCFDLDYHVRHVALPHPGDDRQLAALAGALFSQRLDPQRPLWELWLVEGVADGRWAVVCKMHHCLVDGIAGVSAIATLLLNPVPDETVRPPRPWTPAPAPSALRVYVDELARRLPDRTALVDGVRAVLTSESAGLGFAARALRSMAKQFVDAVAPATETPYNGDVGPDRRLAWARVELGVVEEIRAALGGTLNDVRASGGAASTSTAATSASSCR
jgi:WS/DGAT/MGAT family acyltransferase